MFVRVPDEIEVIAKARLTEFKTDLTKCDTSEMYKRYVQQTPACVLTDVGGERIVKAFQEYWGGLDNATFRFVGSASLGFSIKPNRRYGIFDMNTSDIDIAVIDSQFFCGLWRDVHKFTNRNIFWEKMAEFRKHHFDGWIRPDVMPPSMSNEWFDFFLTLRRPEFGHLKIRAGIFESEYFLRFYQLRAIESCREALDT